MLYLISVIYPRRRKIPIMTLNNNSRKDVKGTTGHRLNLLSTTPPARPSSSERWPFRDYRKCLYRDNISGVKAIKPVMNGCPAH